jgi:Transposase DDE domain group 1
MINLRRLALKGPALANACSATICTKLLKIGAAIVRNPGRVRLMLASSHALKAVFIKAAHALAP